MRAVLMLLEHVRHDIAAKMIIPASCEVAGPEHLLILDILVGNRQDLGPKTELTESASHWIISQPLVMTGYGFGPPLDQGRLDDIPVNHIQNSKRSVLVLHRELPVGILGHKIDLPRRQIGNVRLLSLAEAM